jgi:gas vesicle protein
MKAVNLIAGIVAGALIGAMAGLLFAPHKGSVMRKMITRRGGDYVDLLEEKVDDLLQTIDSQIGNVRKEVAGFIKRETMHAHSSSKNGKVHTR